MRKLLTRDEAINQVSAAMTTNLMANQDAAAKFIHTTFSCGYAGLDEYDNEELETALLVLTNEHVKIQDV